jgi:hypothetical protein
MNAAAISTKTSGLFTLMSNCTISDPLHPRHVTASGQISGKQKGEMITRREALVREKKTRGLIEYGIGQAG